MNTHLLSSITLLGGLFALFLTMLAGKQWRVQSAVMLMVLMLALSVWSFGNLLEQYSGTLEGKLFWANIQYFGILLVPAFWMLFVCLEIQHSRWVRPKGVVLLLLEPMVLLFLVWSGSALFRSASRLELMNGIPILVTQRGPAFYVHAVYSYSLLVISTALLLVATVKTKKHQNRNKTILLLLAALAPWIGNYLFLAGFSPIDLTPPAFVVSGFFIGIDVIRFRMIDPVIQARYEVLEQSIHYLMVFDSRDRMIDINRGFADFLCVTKKELLGKPLSYIKERFPLLLDLLDLPGKLGAECEITLRNNGSTHIFRAYYQQIQDSKSELIGKVVSCIDITEKKKMGSEIDDYRILLQETIENASSAIWVLDKEYRYVFFNRFHAEAMKLLYGADIRIGHSFYEYQTLAEDAVKSRINFDRSLGGERIQVEAFSGSPDQERGYFEIIHNPVRSSAGGIVGVSTHVHDLTAYKRMEERLIFEKKRAEEASKAKSLFLSNMSHEIRTPLNSIIGFSQLLSRDPLVTPRQRDDLKIISRSGEHLLDLINEILEIARIESGRILVKSLAFNIRSMMKEIEAMFRHRCNEKGLRFTIELDGTVPESLEGDEGKLKQILINLVGNAVKFTSSGRITIKVHARPAENNTSLSNILLDFSVEDTGSGIPPEEVQEIFSPFQQGEAGIRAGGSGLGLAISTKFAELMGGVLSLESEVGSGSCFTFQVGLRKTEEGTCTEHGDPQVITGLAPGQPSVKILIVDDNKDNRVLLKAMLCPLGFEILEAINGKEALEAYASFAPHAVLLDIRMPVMDGYEAARRIKNGEAGPPVPIIALTASAFEEGKVQAEQSGMEGYLRKPFRQQELLDELKTRLELDFCYAADDNECTELKVADLGMLPGEVTDELNHALQEGDMVRFVEVLHQVEEVHPALARFLTGLAENFEYDSLKELLAEEKAT